MNLSSRRSMHGFALAAVLWLLAGLAILVGSISQISQELAERTRQLRERTTFLESVYGSRSLLLYWLSVTEATPNGYSDGAQLVRADGSPYRARSGSVVRVQDLGGLVNLNKPNRDLLGRYLVVCGVEPEGVESLLDALEDYIDSDNLRHLKGAERDDYAQAGLSYGPRNAKLLSVAEIWRVFGWAAVRTRLEQNGCAEGFTIEDVPATMNFATAPSKVLLAAGFNEEQVGLLTEGRKLSVEEQAARAQAAGFAATAPAMGATGIRVRRLLHITHQEPGSPWRIDYTLRLTAQRDGGPWQIVGPTLASDPSGPSPQPSLLLDWPSNPPAVRINNAASIFSS